MKNYIRLTKTSILTPTGYNFQDRYRKKFLKLNEKYAVNIKIIKAFYNRESIEEKLIVKINYRKFDELISY